jgi:16S rRNA (guanine966-N2)-methyltransferase
VTRIVAGSAGGRRLATASGASTRPTSDRVREAVFSRLEVLLGTLVGTTFLDLYAGSGAVGLEALSRGAARATLVERDRRTARIIRANVATLGLPAATVVTAGVEGYLRAGPAPGCNHDVAFLDPPYCLGEEPLAGVLADLAAQGWLADDAVVVVERSSRSPEPVWPPSVVPAGCRRYGETMVWYGRAS